MDDLLDKPKNKPIDKLIINNNLDSPLYFSDIFSSEELIRLCKNKYENVVVITDDNVGPLYAEKLLTHLLLHQIKAHLITIPAGERSKSREMKQFIEDKMFALACGRDTLMIALGGGVVTDLTGFVAATYCRGIPVIYIPTSLLAMIDASIGGKTGINTVHGKNLLGSFTHPKAMFIDIHVLNTLPEHEYLQAFSEIIKHALIVDYGYFESIESSLEAIVNKDPIQLENIIHRSCEIKSMIVSEDQKEQSKREILNFGHTVAHALETLSEYTVAHGQAVAIGMIIEGYLSNQMGLLSDAHFHRIKKLISNLNIPITFQATFSKADLLEAFNKDKKTRKQQCRFVLLEAIGKVTHINNSYAQVVDPLLLDRALDYMFAQQFPEGS